MNWIKISVGAKLTVTILAMVFVVLALFTFIVSKSTGQFMVEQATDKTVEKTELLVKTMEISEKNFTDTVNNVFQLFKESYHGDFVVDPTEMVMANEVSAPVLRLDGELVNNDNTIPDNFFNVTQSVATIFVKHNDDFIRISTSLKDKNGNRVLGTNLGKQHPAYEKILKGESYNGIVELFGSSYMSVYAPLTDKEGNIIGVYFLGIDITQYSNLIREQINNLQLGYSGYYYVVDASNGKNRGNFVIHPNREGESALTLTDAKGYAFIEDMLKRKNGTLAYDYIEPDQRIRPKLVAFNYLESRKWLVVGSIYLDEISKEAGKQQRNLILMSIVSLLVIGFLLFLIIKTMITRPLNTLRSQTELIAQGDLTAVIDMPRHDEIGNLAKSLNLIGRNLSEVVKQVLVTTNDVLRISGAIDKGNHALSSQTLQQAESLQNTTAVLTDIMHNAVENSTHANDSNDIALFATSVAVEGGDSVDEVVKEISEIQNASQNIVQIVDVIDGIAFQTQILALNAAIEAARAGEQGRGFAVVAGEVGALAHRSSNAAQEIKTVIERIVGEIRDTSKLAAETGGTMKSVVDEIHKVSVAMTEIVDSSRSQISGIEQATQAMEEIDNSAQVNAELVQQATQLTESLKKQAEQLSKQVNLFKIDEHR